MNTSNDSYDVAVFDVLVYEFPSDDPKEFNKKIRRLLTRRRMGPYDEGRVQMLRNVKNYLQDEFKVPQNSKYYFGPTSTTSAGADINQDGLIASIAEKFPNLDPADVDHMVGLAVYVYYLR